MLLGSPTRHLSHKNAHPVHLNRWGLNLSQYESKKITENFVRYWTLNWLPGNYRDTSSSLSSLSTSLTSKNLNESATPIGEHFLRQN